MGGGGKKARKVFMCIFHSKNECNLKSSIGSNNYLENNQSNCMKPLVIHIDSLDLLSILSI